MKELSNKASQEGLDSLKERTERLEKNWDSGILKLMTNKKSPLVLSDYATKVLEEIKFFDNIFPKIKDTLLAELEKHILRTPYDVQEKSMFVVRKFRDEPIYDEMKKAIYNTGNNLDEVLVGIFIPLRDYYFEKHPEIKD